MTARRRLILAILALLSVLVVGALGYIAIEADRGVTFSDALYMTVITLSTVGYGEAWELSPYGKLWTVGVITFGIVTVTYAFGSLVSMVVGGELRSLREQKKMERTLKQLRDHVILCGYGRMGVLVTAELRHRGQKIVVIETRHDVAADLRERNVPFLVADATDEETLLQAGLERARALVSALPSDADNVYITLTAHTLRPGLSIVARAEHPSTVAKLKRAGATRVVCPPVTGAMRVADVLTRPTVVDFVELANQGVDLEIDEYVIGQRSPLVGTTLRESRVRAKTGAVVVAIKRADGEAIVNPNPDDGLAMGDTLVLVGPTGISNRLDVIDAAP